MAPAVRERLIRSGYFVSAVLLHLIAFVLLATFVIFKPPPPPPADSFLRVALPQPSPPPPTPPAAAGGAANNALEPDLTVTPPPTPTTVIASNLTSLAFNSAKVKIPSLPAAFSNAKGSGLGGSGSAGAGSGSAFGSTTDDGSGLMVGYLYDLKQTADRKPTGMTPGQYHQILGQFVKRGWDESILTAYYKYPTPLYASHILIPDMDAFAGPSSFHAEKEVAASMWIVLYKVKRSPPQSGAYYFAGFADDILLVRVEGDTVLDGSITPVADGPPPHVPWPNDWVDENRMGESYHYGQLRESSRLALPGGLPVNIEVLIGEEPGGQFSASLFMLRDGVEYAKDAKGAPKLPLFQVGDQPVDLSGAHPPVSDKPEPW